MSELDVKIHPQIQKGSKFYETIQKIVGYSDVEIILEIGSSSGEGSTQALVSGMRKSSVLHCLEVSKVRFVELQRRYKDNSNVNTYNVSSILLTDFPSEEEIRIFYQTIKSVFNKYSLERVLGWLKQDIEYIIINNIPDGGIQQVKKINNTSIFDVILIDGSEFTGKVELDELCGAKYILLDDIRSYKNFENFQRLCVDFRYRLVIENNNERNGFAVFERKEI
ncbi:MAG: hypothetical protein QQN62_03875 [Nitrosopumilus sp.]